MDLKEGSKASPTAAAKVRIQMVQAKLNSLSPDYRVFRGEAEVGAAWRKKNREGQRYLVVSLDDPAFSKPIQCRLVPANATYCSGRGRATAASLLLSRLVAAQ